MNEKYLGLIYREKEFIESKGKEVEFHHIVKTISKLDGVNLKEAKEEPDCILQKNGVDIGMEIITLVNEKKRARSNIIQKVLNRIAAEIQGTFSVNYLFDIYFYDEIDYDKRIMFEECKKVIQFYIQNSKIIDCYLKNKDYLTFYVRNDDALKLYTEAREAMLFQENDNEILNIYLQEKDEAINHYITNRHIIDYFIENKYIENIHNGGRANAMTLCFNPGAVMISQLTEVVLNNFIDKKNKKIATYKKNLKGADCWLLLVTSTNDYQYDIFDLYPPSITTLHSFDKVLLLHDLKNKLFEWDIDKWNLIE